MNIEVDEVSIVTMNRHKYEEASRILRDKGFSTRWVRYEPLEIQSDSLLEIVIWKGFDASKIVYPPFIVEDTGLFIWGLNGFPGVYSSYVLKKIGVEGVLRLMANMRDRRASFISYGLLYLGKQRFKVFKARVDGYISTEARGDKGFGYDPIFIPNGFEKTFGELDIDIKNSVSHRGKLFIKVAEYLDRLEEWERIV